MLTCEVADLCGNLSDGSVYLPDRAVQRISQLTYVHTIALDGGHEHLTLGGVLIVSATEDAASIAIAEDGCDYDKGDDVLEASVVAEEASTASVVVEHTHEHTRVNASLLKRRQNGSKQRVVACVKVESLNLFHIIQGFKSPAISLVTQISPDIIGRSNVTDKKKEKKKKQGATPKYRPCLDGVL